MLNPPLPRRSRESGSPASFTAREESRWVPACAGTTEASPLADALLARYAGFAATLRANGFRVASPDVADAIDVAARSGQLERKVLRWHLRALLCSRAEEWRRFDDLFDSYFFPPNRSASARGQGGRGVAQPSAGRPASDCHGLPYDIAGNGSDADPGDAAREGASADATLAQADLRHLNHPDDLYAVDAAVRRFANRLHAITMRRERAAPRGSVIDIRTTIRHSVSTGGQPLELAWRQKRRLRPRLVLLLDVSRSMSLYSFFFLRLARVLSARVSDVHSFVFHTRLVNVAQALRDPDPWRSQERLELLSAGWAGGTRIGDSLAEFQRHHAAALLHSRTAVIVVSDGYDAGEPSVLRDALSRIRRRCRALVWINPLASRPGFTPTSAGMSAALPFLDLLAGARDLASLERVLPRILHVLQ